MGAIPRAAIAQALTAVERDGLRVDEVHRGHCWGVLVCTKCGEDLPIWSTPRVPEDLARRIRRFDQRHRH